MADITSQTLTIWHLTSFLGGKGGGGKSVTLNLTSLYFGANCFREQGGILPEFSFFLSDL